MSDLPDDPDNELDDDMPDGAGPAATRDRSFLIGVAYSTVVALVMIGGIYLLGGSSQRSVFTTTLGALLPVMMGLAAAYGWRQANPGAWRLIGWTSANLGIALLLSAILLREGVFCLLIISPLVLAMMALGVWIGTLLFRRKRTGLNVSLAALLLLFAFIDILSPHYHRTLVGDTIIIHAPASEVWEHVVAFPAITSRPSYWFFNIGLPMPASTTVDAYRKGAGRKCIFSNGLVFDEVMTEFDPARRLTFDITHQPEDPEIMGHITLQRGQFLLTDNGDGTTTLTGNSWYTLHAFPAWYFDLWAESIVRNVHMRVMEHIRDLSEKQGN